MTVIRLVKALASLPRKWSCHYRGPGCFKTHDLTRLGVHHDTHHAGDALPKGHR